MADIAKIKRNVAKMAAQGAPVEDIDGYIASQGVTVDDVRNFRPQQAAQPQAAPQMGMGEDMARSGATGLRQGTEGLVGMFGDAAQMQGDIAGWVAGKFGASPETQESVTGWGRKLNPFGMAPTTDEIQSVTRPVIGENYQPQTTAGEYARTVGQFAPGAFTGPGGLARKTAMTVVPALASETAGQLTKGTAAEPYARGAAALVGGVATAGKPNVAKMAAKGAPTAEALKSQTDDLYGALRSAGIRYDADEYGNMVTRIATDLRKKGLRKSTAESAMAIVDDLATDIGKSPDFDDINSWISSAGGKARELRRQGKDQEAMAVDIIRDHLDDFEESAVMVSNTPLPKEQFDGLRKTARATALKNIKGRALQEIIDRSDTYTSGQEAGIRNGIGNLLRSKKGMQLFRGEERQALLDVQHGRKALRTLSRFGFDLTKVSGNGTFLPAMAGAATSFIPGVGLAGAGGLAAAGTAAKVASPILTKRAFETAAAGVRSGNLASKPMMDAAKAKRMQAFVRTLLAAKSGENSAIANTPVR